VTPDQLAAVISRAPWPADRRGGAGEPVPGWR